MAGERSFFKKLTYTEGIYPKFSIDYIQNPNRLYAIPLLGLLIKLIMLLPLIILLIFVGIWWLIAIFLINPFVVLITSKYWRGAYSINLAMMRVSAKISSFIFGLTDKYPGFNFENGDSKIEVSMPENPNKLLAIPILGGLIRLIFLIPYYFFGNIISTASTIGTFLVAWALVLFKGKYPESIFELSRDSIRVGLSSMAYLTGLSDKYPSFYISMKHDKIKIILIVIALLLSGMGFVNGEKRGERYSENENFNGEYNELLEEEFPDIDKFQEN